MLRTIAIGTLILAGASTIVYAADVYRWVDEHGGVHYTDQWVAGAEVIKSTKPRPATPDADTTHRSLEQQRLTDGGDRASAQLAQESATRAVKQDLAKLRDQQCKEAKERYEKAIAARRIYKPVKAGDKDKDADRPENREYISEEEADAYRVKARTDMDEACAGAPK
ncbi:MAG: DUF4124 domain-containing protein [Steroidobacteraceae bacterium]